MKKTFLAILLFCALMALPARGLAWGKQGHEIVAGLAFHFLDPATQQRVLKALDGLSFEEAATWMDDIRSNKSFETMRPWHYIDIEKGKEYEPTPDKNALTILNAVMTKLQQHGTFMGNQQRDLLLLFHLVGDIHQPLHAGYPGDRGGNTINLDYEQTQVNLHALWDTRIIADEKITVAGCLDLYATWPKEKTEAVRQARLMTWVNESRSLLPEVYAFGQDRIDKAYCAKSKLLVEQQLLTAGLRLAEVLQKAFGAAEPGATNK